jgi:hypothetical protein
VLDSVWPILLQTESLSICFDSGSASALLPDGSLSLCFSLSGRLGALFSVWVLRG